MSYHSHFQLFDFHRQCRIVIPTIYSGQFSGVSSVVLLFLRCIFRCFSFPFCTCLHTPCDQPYDVTDVFRATTKSQERMPSRHQEQWSSWTILEHGYVPFPMKEHRELYCTAPRYKACRSTSCGKRLRQPKFPQFLSCAGKQLPAKPSYCHFSSSGIMAQMDVAFLRGFFCKDLPTWIFDYRVGKFDREIKIAYVCLRKH